MVIAKEIKISSNFKLEILKELDCIESTPRYESFRKAGVKVWLSFAFHYLKKKESSKDLGGPTVHDFEIRQMNGSAVQKAQKIIMRIPLQSVIRIMNITVPFGIAMIASHTECCEIFDESLSDEDGL